MYWLTILLIGMAASIDNFGVGFTFGIQGKNISFMANLFMTVIALCLSYASLIIGSFLGHFIPASFSNSMGGLLILIIGIWTLFNSVFKNNKQSKTMSDPNYVDKDHNNVIAFNEAFLLGLALSLNAAGIAFGAGVTGLSPVFVPLSVAVFSFLTIDIGQRMGLKLFKTRLNHFFSCLSALLLILIGIYEIFS